MPNPQEATPLISLVISCYNVAEYLPAFLRSLDEQSYPHSDVEIVFVDDGSTDATSAILRSWIAATSFIVKLHGKENGGLSSARNAGMAIATGRWVSFPDPDDVLSEGYLDAIAAQLRAITSSNVQIVAANIIWLDDATGVQRNTHPLRRRFQSGAGIYSIGDRPDMLHLSAATGFFRLSSIRTAQLEFDTEIRPNFEDAHLVARLLLESEDPHIAVAPQARYLYRQRLDSSSLVQSSWSKPEKYDNVLRLGILPLLHIAEERSDGVPLWLQYLALYEIFFYYRADDRIHSETAGLTDATKATFNTNIDNILQYISEDAIRSFDATNVPRWIRTAVLGIKCGKLDPTVAVVGPVDKRNGLVRVRYEYAGDEPAEELLIGGIPTIPTHSKRRSIAYFDRVCFIERIAWVPTTASLSVRVDGQLLKLERSYPRGPRFTWRFGSGTTKRRTGCLRSVGRRMRASMRSVRPRFKTFAVRVIVRAVRMTPIGKPFRHAWILVDRDVQAHDNAEHLYGFLCREHPEVNAWFALSKSSPDWQRLKRQGFRLLQYGSTRHRIALLNCDELVSSQVDHYVTSPLPGRLQRYARWRFTFLQHGVTKDDLSRWLNGKRIDTCLTTTPSEYASLAADFTPYNLTSHEVRLTGMPRHDRLVAIARSTPKQRRKSIVVMPTWRRGLMGTTVGSSNLRTLREEFWTSNYYLQWKSLLESPSIAQLAISRDLRIVLMPHPNLAPYIAPGHFGAHVEVVGYTDADFQQVIAESCLVVTDYSSNAFEAAIANRPVLYYQFDQEEFFGGSHVYRMGYFDYVAHGYGPVVSDLGGALDSIESYADSDFVVPRKYAERAASDFGNSRDGLACERTFAAIRNAPER